MTKVDKSKMTPAEKAAHTKKWRRASALAHERARNAKTFAKYILSQKGYKCISLDTRKGYEYKGVVDLVAVKRDKKEPGSLEIVLIQVKGGSARVTTDEIRRLKTAIKNARVDWNVAEKPGRTVQFRKKM